MKKHIIALCTVFMLAGCQTAGTDQTVYTVSDIMEKGTEVVSSELSKKDAEKALKAFVDVVTDELKAGGKVQLVGFGSFEVADRAARNGVNPLTGKPMNVPACKAPKFKAGKALKEAVNK